MSDKDTNSTSIEKIEKATNAVQMAGGVIGQKIGGKLGKAFAGYLTGNAGLIASTSDLLDKTNNKTATGDEIADSLQDIAAIVSGIGVMIGYANPWTLGVLAAVGVGRFALEYAENNNYDIDKIKNKP